MERILPGKGVDDLLCGPARVRMFGDVEMYDASAILRQDDEGVQNAKRGSRHDEEINRGEILEVVEEESARGLRRWFSMPRHEAGNGCRCEIESELEKLTVNTGCAPRRILIGHAANEFSNFRAFLRAPTRCTALPSSEQLKILAMSADDGFGLRDDQGLAPFGENATPGRPERTVYPGESGAMRIAFQDGQLLPQGQVFQREFALRFEARSCCGEEGQNQVQHARTGARLGRGNYQ